MRSLVVAAAVLLLAAAAAASIVPAPDHRLEFENFVRDFGRTYAAREYRARFAIFRHNLDFINQWNAEQNGVTLAVNQFADLTNAEFNARYKGLNVTALQSRPRHEVEEFGTPAISCPAGTISPNSTCDWRAANVVTPVKNQGQCGSCWAFSTTGSVEGAYALAKSKLVSLSEQNLVDCSSSEGNEGCNGGLMDYAFEYIIKNKGIDTEASYAYTARDGNCKFQASNVGATISSYKDVKKDSEPILTTAIQTLGPVSVAIDANHNSFQFYRSGVYYEKSCSSSQLDHGVLAVGFGTASGQDYYIVKNSWGTSWGDKGYILMSRNRKNNCGIATASSYPIA